MTTAVLTNLIEKVKHRSLKYRDTMGFYTSEFRCPAELTTQWLPAGHVLSSSAPTSSSSSCLVCVTAARPVSAPTSPATRQTTRRPMTARSRLTAPRPTLRGCRWHILCRSCLGRQELGKPRIACSPSSALLACMYSPKCYKLGPVDRLVRTYIGVLSVYGGISMARQRAQ